MDDKELKENSKIIKIPKYKKIWYACTKFEKYPEMAAEGVGRAISYLAWLIFIFAIIMAIGLIIKFHGILVQECKFIEENFSEINYSNGELKVVGEINNTTTSYGNVIINTDELTEEQIKEYEEKTSSKPEFIWLKDKVLVKIDSNTFSYEYKNVLDELDIKEFDKQKAMQFLQERVTSPQLYIIYGIVMIAYTFIVYFIATLADVLILSVFGEITSLIAGIKIRYRAIFNMTVYSFTISTLLRLIYLYIGLFSDFNIKYFDLMYTTIAFICLAAAIFMIKSDFIKQQIELMRIIEIKKQEEQEKQEEKEDKEEEKEENKKEEKPEDDENKENKTGKEDLDTGTQGGEA